MVSVRPEIAVFSPERRFSRELAREREFGATLDRCIHVPTSSPDEHEIGKTVSAGFVSKRA
jgi:hypothetical protein